VRDLIPSLVNSFFGWHSTVRALRKSRSPISGFDSPSRGDARSAAPAASAHRESPPGAYARSAELDSGLRARAPFRAAGKPERFLCGASVGEEPTRSPRALPLSPVPAHLVGSGIVRGGAACFCRCPARKQTERLRGPRARLSGVRHDHQAGVSAELQPVEAELQLAHDRMVELLAVTPTPRGRPSTRTSGFSSPSWTSPTRRAPSGRSPLRLCCSGASTRSPTTRATSSAASSRSSRRSRSAARSRPASWAR